MHASMALRGKPVLTSHTPISVPALTSLPVAWPDGDSIFVSVFVRCLHPFGSCGLSGLSQGGGYHCELFLFILVQVLYLVGVLLMTFDLLTCGQSQGSGFQ